VHKIAIKKVAELLLLVSPICNIAQ